jgi:hypothetical protein
VSKRKKSRSQLAVDQVSASADAAADAAKRAAQAAADRSVPLFDAASGRVVPAAQAARHAAEPALSAAWEKAAPLIEQARSRAGDVAHDHVAPRVEMARGKLVDDVAPRVGAAVTGAIAASAPYREEAARRGGAALAALKGEVEAPKKKRHIGRNLLVVSGIAGLVALAYKYLTGESKSSGWQTPSGTTYTPPRPSAAPAPAATTTSDAAAATAADGTVEDPDAVVPETDAEADALADDGGAPGRS